MSLPFHVFLHLMVHPLRGQSTWLLSHYQGQWVVIIGPSNWSIWTTIKAVRTINKLTYAWHKWCLINQSRGVSMELRWLFWWMACHDFMTDIMIVWHGNVFRITGPLWGESTITSGSSHKVNKGLLKQSSAVHLLCWWAPNLLNKQPSFQWFEMPWPGHMTPLWDSFISFIHFGCLQYFKSQFSPIYHW